MTERDRAVLADGIQKGKDYDSIYTGQNGCARLRSGAQRYVSSGPASELKSRVKARFDEMAEKCGDVELVTIDDTVEGGMLWDLRDADRVVELFRAKRWTPLRFLTATSDRRKWLLRWSWK